ncbi:hypothetical protein C4J81_04365 [Deltaproteobacteria bacterium Smac51]|nr:hypothetical protein C4J81_04365 [Deltaproteobacteria bacterium Smac51]
MQFECIQCHKLLKLPDAKLPVGKPFSFTCPYCKAKNTAMLPAGEEAQPEEHPEAATTVLPQSPPVEANAMTSDEPADEHQEAPPSDMDNSSEDETFSSGETPQEQERPDENYQESPEPEPGARPVPPTPLRPGDVAGTNLPYPKAGLMEEDFDLTGMADDRPKALVVYDDPEVAEALVQKLDAINYRAIVAMNLRDAAKQIKFTKFVIMLLQEDYFGSSLSGNHLLRSVQVMDNHSRRGMLVALISPALTTLDDLTAFSLSVDAIINTADIDQIDQLLLSSIAQARKFFTIYEEVLSEHGLD